MRRPDPVEVAAIVFPVMAEILAVVLFIAMVVVWSVILRGGA